MVHATSAALVMVVAARMVGVVGLVLVTSNLVVIC
jgi:hypothetical protein